MIYLASVDISHNSPYHAVILSDLSSHCLYRLPIIIKQEILEERNEEEEEEEEELNKKEFFNNYAQNTAIHAKS